MSEKDYVIKLSNKTLYHRIRGDSETWNVAPKAQRIKSENMISLDLSSKDQNINHNQKPVFGFTGFVVTEFQIVKLTCLSARHAFNVM